MLWENIKKIFNCHGKAIQIDHNDVETWFNKGNILLQQGKNEEALKCFDK